MSDFVHIECGSWGGLTTGAIKRVLASIKEWDLENRDKKRIDWKVVTGSPGRSVQVYLVIEFELKKNNHI